MIKVYILGSMDISGQGYFKIDKVILGSYSFHRELGGF